VRGKIGKSSGPPKRHMPVRDATGEKISVVQPAAATPADREKREKMTIWTYFQDPTGEKKGAGGRSSPAAATVCWRTAPAPNFTVGIPKQTLSGGR